MGITVDPCDKCRKVFKPMKRKNKHLKFCGKTIDCSECGKIFKTRQVFVGHKNTKHSENFKCSICQKCFEGSWKLLRYEISHMKRNMSSCNQCNKLFSRKDNMLQHKKEPLKRNIQKCLAVTDEIWHWWNMSLYVQSLSKYIVIWRSTSVFYYFFR